MKLSKKGEYGIKALVKMAINYEKKVNVTLINEIAEGENLPQKYLEHILLTLKNGGMLVSKRGVGGGYSLSKSPEEITLGQVIRIIDGHLAPMSCVSQSRPVKCPDETSCGLYGVMLQVRNAISEIVDNISLKELAKKTVELKEKKKCVIDYAI